MTIQASSLLKKLDFRCILLFLLVLVTSSPTHSAVISGTVSLPQFQSVPPGEVYNISFVLEDVNSETIIGDKTYSQIVSGRSSVFFSKIVPDTPNALWRVSYVGVSFPIDKPFGEKYYKKAYYSSSGTTWFETDATLLQGGQNHTNINMTLKPALTIKGTFSLPFGTAPTGGINVDLFVKDVDKESIFYHTSVKIPGGNSGVSYVFVLPTYIEAKWLISYLYLGTEYINVGHYADTGAVVSENEASLLQGAKFHTNINFSLIGMNIIEGDVVLNEGVAPQGGIYVDVSAVSIGGGFGTWRDIIVVLEGENSASFSIRVLAEDSTSWRVAYSIRGDLTTRPGYYSLAGTVVDRNEASLLPGGFDYSDIDMTLFESKVISGTVRLPLGMILSTDLSFIVIATSSAGSKFDRITIPAGDISVEYSITVPFGTAATWLIRYFSVKNDNLLSRGYYSALGTVSGGEEATELIGGTNYSSIDLELLKIKSFPWNLFLPTIIRNTVNSSLTE